MTGASSFDNQTALVTGASSGIGWALAVALAERGAKVVLQGRDEARLAAVAEAVAAVGPAPETRAVDLRDDAALAALAEGLPAVDLLINNAGVCTLGTVETTSTEDFDLNWAVNLRAPYLLTRDLLPKLRAAGGQVVFVNSGAGLTANPTWSAYAASKHGLKALADSLRAEVRGEGVRVLSVYPGRTASPMQAAIKAHEGAAYTPETLIQPEDVAKMTIQALELPRTAHVVDVNIRGT